MNPPGPVSSHVHRVVLSSYREGPFQKIVMMQRGIIPVGTVRTPILDVYCGNDFLVVVRGVVMHPFVKKGRWDQRFREDA